MNTCVVLAAVVLVLAPHQAHARAAGIATPGCDGCHTGGAKPTVSISASQPNPQTGATLTLTITIPAVNGGPGGLYLRSNGPGQFTLVSNQNTRLVTQDEVVHSTPRAASNGAVTFNVQWTAPTTKGGVDFDVYALAANGNGTATGDGAGATRLSLAYGCAGITYYRDLDGDGVGSQQSGTTKDCALPPGYSLQDGDCDDNDETVFPGQPETCNGKDDDCDGQTDDGLPVQTFYEDADGDGHGVLGGATKMACTAPAGFASTTDDCVDTDPARHPGAAEVCNFLDDNCDGRTDEGARITCGVGMCARYGLSCDPALCTPGRPEPEACNYLDDDCDGVIDNNAACPSGQYCAEGKCVAGAAPPPPADAGQSAQKPPYSTSVGCSVAEGAALWPLLLVLRFVPRRRRMK